MNLQTLPLLLLVATLTELAAAEPFLPTAPTHLRLNTPEGRTLLVTSKQAEPYWQLTQYFTSQPDLGSCGIATSVCVLNALGIQRPTCSALGKFPFFTPENLLTGPAGKIVTRAQVSTSGMSLAQFAKVMQASGAKVTCIHAEEGTLAQFRTTLAENFGKQGHFVAVNYLRKALDQEIGGHISPLGAWNSQRDLVLILDTSNYKYPWTWVPLEALWKAMTAQTDSTSGKSRGYVLVER